MLLSSSSFHSGHIVWLAVLISKAIAVASYQLNLGPVDIVEQLKIVPVVYDQLRAQLEPGHMYGARQCGGTGKVLELKQSGCLTEVPKICSRIVDVIDKVSSVFIPNENINDVVTRVSVTTHDGKVSKVDVPMDGVNLTAGQTYQYSMAVIMKSPLKNKIFTGRLEFFSRSNYRARTCTEVDIFVGGKE